MILRTWAKWLIGILSVGACGGLSAGGYFLFSNLDKYKNYSITPTTDNLNSMLNAYYGATLQGAQAIMCPGFSHQVPIEEAYNNTFYRSALKDTGFLLFDSKVDANSYAASNTWNMVYRTDLGSIEVGIAVAYFLNYYQDTFLNNGSNDNTLTYAMWGGIPIDSVTSFMGGFQKGVDWANKNLKGKKINNFEYKEVKQVFSDNGNEFTGGFGPSDGINTMVSIIKKRPDVLMPVAGPQIWTAQDEILKLGDSKTILIGVDSAVENDPKNKELNFKSSNNEKIGNGKRIQFSSLKNLKRSGQAALEIINNGNIIPKAPSDDPNRYWNFSENGIEGEVSGIGTVAVGDSKNGNVGISQDGKKWYDESLKLSSTASKPSEDPIYSELKNMNYIGFGNKEYSYSTLLQKFQFNNNNKETLNLKNFIKKGEQKDADKIKIILSTSSSILMDASFSQSCYEGVYAYLKSMDINIPNPPSIEGGK